MNEEARVRFERRIDDAAKRTVRQILQDCDPLIARSQVRALLRKFAREATQTPDLFDPAEVKEQSDAENQ